MHFVLVSSSSTQTFFFFGVSAIYRLFEAGRIGAWLLDETKKAFRIPVFVFHLKKTRVDCWMVTVHKVDSPAI